MGKVLFFILFSFTCFAEEFLQQVSSTMGHMIGKNLKTLGFELDMDAVARGLKEESEGKKAPLSEEECAQAVLNLQEQEMRALSNSELKRLDTLSNGDQIQDYENYPFSAPNPPKYW